MFSRFIIGALGIGLLVGLIMPGSQPVGQPATVAAAVPEGRDLTSSRPTPAMGHGEHMIERASDGHFYVEAQVNGRPVRFLVDTGASAVVLTMADAQRTGLPFSLQDFSVIARGASGDVRGQRIRLGSVAVGDQMAYDVDGAVVAEGLDVSLLGQSYLSRLRSVEIDGNRMTLR